jgi:hypothetical protein
MQDAFANMSEVIFIIVFYLFFPTLIFGVSVLVIGHRCENTGRRIKSAENQFKKLTSGM